MNNNTGVVGALSTAFTIVMIGSHGQNIGPIVGAPSLAFAGAVVESHQQQRIRDKKEAVTAQRTPVKARIKITDANGNRVLITTALAAYKSYVRA